MFSFVVSTDFAHYTLGCGIGSDDFGFDAVVIVDEIASVRGSRISVWVIITPRISCVHLLHTEMKIADFSTTRTFGTGAFTTSRHKQVKKDLSISQVQKAFVREEGEGARYRTSTLVLPILALICIPV